MALLGKISAVLTASTADFTRKIGLAKNDLASFQKRVSGIQLNLNTRALDGTLTKLQKFKREVDELRRLRSLGVDLGFDPRRLTDQFKAFEEIGKPLTDVKNKIEGLSLSIQAELYPELEKVSSGFRNLYRDIETGVTTWDKSEKRVAALTASLSRLSRATAAAADFGRLSSALRQETAGASFFQPRAQESLQRSRALRDQAAQVPARFRSDAFADLADSADENAARIERQAARVIAIEARIARQGAAPNLLNARSAAQDNLDSLTRRQEAINAGFQRQIRESRLASIISPKDVSAVDLFATRLESLSSQLREIDSQQFQGLISNATAVVRQFNAGEVSAKKAKQAVDALAASLNSVNTSRTLENQTRSLLFTDAERRRQQIQSDFDSERSAGARGAGQRRDANLTRERLNNEIIPRARNLQQQAAESGDADLQRRAERLTQLSRQINNELRKATRSANNGQVDAANRSIANANALLERQLRLEQQISRELDEITAARRQQDMFLEASGGRGELLSQGARDAAADISTARQFRGQIADGASRNRIQREIDRVTQTVTGLQREMARVENSDLGADEKIAELDRLDRAVRQTTAGLARTVAQNSGGAFSEARVADAMRLARNTAGSLSTRGAASAQLAIQQGLFAIDDLISSTGGLEYKLRAVGNNITQLGLLLGQSGLIPGLTATTGLFIGLATVLGGQALSAIVRWYGEGRTAEDQVKALNDAMSRQKAILDDLAQAYSKVADSIRDAGLSERDRQNESIRRQVEEIKAQQQKARESRILSVDTGVAEARGDVARAEREVGRAETVGQRIRAQLDLDAASERLRQTERRTIRNANRPVGDVRGAAIAGLEESVRSVLQDRLERATAGAVGGPGGGGGVAAVRGNVEQENQRLLQEARARFNLIGNAPQEVFQAIEDQVRTLKLGRAPDGVIVALEQLRERLKQTTRQLEADNLTASVSDAALRAASSLDNARDIISQSFAGLPSPFDSGIRALSEDNQRLQREAGEAAASGRPEDVRFIRDLISATQRQAAVAVEAASAVRLFAEAIEAATQEAQQNLSSARQAASDSRRASLGFGSDTNRSAADRAEFDFELQRSLVSDLSSAAATALERAADAVAAGDSVSAAVRDTVARIQEIDTQLSTAGVIAAGARETLAAERARLQQQVAELDPAVAAARDASTREEERRQSALRGRQGLLSQGERAGEELVGQIRDLRQATRSDVASAIREGRFGEIEQIQARGREAEARLLSEQSRQVAPAIFSLADSVQNAVLQGPSRAALNVSDISTQEGARELNRLLRGDDPARDNTNLIELQRQSQLLEDNNRILREKLQTA